MELQKLVDDRGSGAQIALLLRLVSAIRTLSARARRRRASAVSSPGPI